MEKEMKKQRMVQIDDFLRNLRKNMEEAIELDTYQEYGHTTRRVPSIGPYPYVEYNGTATFVIKINGGARDN